MKDDDNRTRENHFACSLHIRHTLGVRLMLLMLLVPS